MAKLTPMMQQYMEIKNKHKNCILFFRLGDFYEMFFEDAITASKELEITLTKRECGLKEKAPMCGVPFHSADSYIRKLVEKGYKVAICEQVENPADAIGIVKRDVVKIITLGTISDPKMLEEKSNNYLLSLFFDKKTSTVGISYTDITAGEIYTTEIKINDDKDVQKVLDELGKISPREIIINEEFFGEKFKNLFNKFENFTSKLDSWYFEKDLAIQNIKKQFNLKAISSIGIEKKSSKINSTGALIEYLFETQKSQVENIRKINSYNSEDYMVLDINTRINLELIESIRGNKKKGSLLSVLDYTETSMGGRLLRKWIEEPLLDKDIINKRLDYVENLKNDLMISDDIRDCLKRIYDIERLISRIVQGNSNGRVLISLKNSLKEVPKLKSILENSSHKNLKDLSGKIESLDEIKELIENSIEEECPIGVNEGNLIKEEYSEELKELRNISRNGKEYLFKLEEKERNKTGIKNLKVSYNKVFGYYIEVTKSNIDKVPDNYIRKQTLANSERYIIDELKEIENKILNSKDKMIELEYTLFTQIREKIKKEVDRIQNLSKKIAFIDVLQSISKAAFMNSYSRPNISDSGKIKIKNGRHPVVELMVEDNSFISNDTNLDIEENRINIITGPNMSGKSTYMRQVALISLMAQIGSFVPADYADISISDKIFTRIGASDDLSEGQSTFMVEMIEVANILNNSTENSLIILDEIGRGTSTYDGLSIAWSVVEYISQKDKIGAKTLFATHYHELTELENQLAGVKNYRVSVKEKDGEGIVFLRKIERGGANRSYGIEVARLAGISEEVISRAYEILEQLEKEDINSEKMKQSEKRIQESFLRENSEEVFQVKKNKNSNSIKEKKFYQNIVEELENIDLMNMTPLDAINKIYDLKTKIKKEYNKL